MTRELRGEEREASKFPLREKKKKKKTLGARLSVVGENGTARHEAEGRGGLYSRDSDGDDHDPQTRGRRAVVRFEARRACWARERERQTRERDFVSGGPPRYVMRVSKFSLSPFSRVTRFKGSVGLLPLSLPPHDSSRSASLSHPSKFSRELPLLLTRGSAESTRADCLLAPCALPRTRVTDR